MCDGSTQASLAILLSLACLGALHLAQPFRDQSDNTVAVLCQVTAFLWLYVLQQCVIDVMQGAPMIVFGSLLVFATIGLFLFVAHAAWMEDHEVDGSVAKSEGSIDDDGDVETDLDSPHEIELQVSSRGTSDLHQDGLVAVSTMSMEC